MREHRVKDGHNFEFCTQEGMGTTFAVCEKSLVNLTSGITSEDFFTPELLINNFKAEIEFFLKLNNENGTMTF
jgi:hypothetical protein